MNWLTQGVEFHGKALVLRAQRAEVLAANIANADTPNYKSKDMDFGAALQRSMQTGNQNLSRTHASHFELSGANGSRDINNREFDYEIRGGNTVDAEVELSEYAENAVRFQASAQFLDGALQGLHKAWRGE